MSTAASPPQESVKRQRSHNLCHSPPKHKRPRAASTGSIDLDDSRPDMAFDASVHMLVKRDANYYFEDGSCIFLVKDTLFNVHRSILSKDASSFSTMFSLPQGNQQAEGNSDDNPIILSGDTVTEFRNFLWALYALPHELRVATSPEADIGRLVDVARVSNKYSFKSLETWALDVVHDYVNRKPSPILSGITPAHAFAFNPNPPAQAANACPPNTEQLTKLVRLAQLCGHKPLLDTLVDHLRHLMSFSPQHAYLAMTLADELDIRSLRGLAYFEVMQRAVVVKPDKRSQGDDKEVQEGDVDDKGRLVVNTSQQLRLLSGYYRLTRSWEELRTTPPPFDHSSSCGATWHQHGCSQSWLEFWKERSKVDAVLTLGLADTVGRLKQIQKEFDKWGSAPYMHNECRSMARKGIQEAVKKVEESLPDVFSE